MVPVNVIANELSFGCIWEKSMLETAIKQQNELEEKQSYYIKENGKRSKDYDIQIERMRETERKARAEVNRVCK
jgi:pyruvate/2-oxoglutarate dehydrogenase complex dihydrolipoamide dehydrogenase (E3) component